MHKQSTLIAEHLVWHHGKYTWPGLWTGVCQGAGPGAWLRCSAHPFVVLSTGGMLGTLRLLPTSCFCSSSSEVAFGGFFLVLLYFVVYNLGFPGGSAVKNLRAGDMRDMDLIPGSGRCPRGGHRNPLQYSCLENPMDRGRCPWGHKESGMTEATGHACMSVICPNCACTQLFLVPHSFFVLCCSRRNLSRCKHCSKGFQVPGCLKRRCKYGTGCLPRQGVLISGGV